jgi:hypothetical protein
MRAAVAERRPGSAASESDEAITTHPVAVPAGSGYELCFHSLLATERGLSFPCDAAGRVDMDALSDKARDDYLYARTVVGRVFRPPSVRAQ